MATSQKIKEVMLQYSKKMATRVTIFWMLYRIVISILIFLRPEISTAMQRLTEGADTIMIVNMSTYTLNSSTEKVAIAFTQRKSIYNDTEKDDKDEEEEKIKDEEYDETNG